MPSDAIVGFTFSFPVEQQSLSRGRLLAWTKNFAASGVEGNEVTMLLEDALQQVGLGSVRIVALVNDTAGTLMAQRYRDGECGVGVILGTGTNAAYVEHTKNIPKWKGDKGGEGSPMVINMEWGAFGSGSAARSMLPLTDIDSRVDQCTENPGEQRFEKMISGRYLGEITRVILEDLRAAGLVFVPEHIRAARRQAGGKAEIGRGSSAAEMAAAAAGGGAVDSDIRLGDDDVVPLDSALRRPWSLDAGWLSAVQRDESDDMGATESTLRKVLSLRSSTIEDRRIVKDVCMLVARRAARLAAVGIAAVVKQMEESNPTQPVSAGIDGSVYEKHPCIKTWMEEALLELGVQCHLVHSPDGSGLGAAIVAAAAATHGAAAAAHK